MCITKIEYSSIALSRSVVTLPEFKKEASPLVIDFLCSRFPNISRELWLKRIESGKVLDHNKRALNIESRCVPCSKIYYFREVASEPVIPFKESIIFQNDHLLVADKPHFLPVTPSGKYVNQSLLNRLKIRTGIDEISPIHRIDRETAGLVLFSVDKKSRALYQKMFMDGTVKKRYLALTHCSDRMFEKFVLQKRLDARWSIKNRIIQGEPWFRMKIDNQGEINAVTEAEIIGIMKLDNKRLSINNTLNPSFAAIFRLFPKTGKKHQLRLHLSSIGFPIINDRLYPELMPEETQINFANPLKLLAQQIEFNDPVSGGYMEFKSSFSIIDHESENHIYGNDITLGTDLIKF
ncbi:MAG: pseudouridine synthase [Desulfamplus sp.]